MSHRCRHRSSTDGCSAAAFLEIGRRTRRRFVQRTHLAITCRVATDSRNHGHRRGDLVVAGPSSANITGAVTPHRTRYAGCSVGATAPRRAPTRSRFAKTWAGDTTEPHSIPLAFRAFSKHRDAALQMALTIRRQNYTVSANVRGRFPPQQPHFVTSLRMGQQFLLLLSNAWRISVSDCPVSGVWAPRRRDFRRHSLGTPLLRPARQSAENSGASPSRHQKHRTSASACASSKSRIMLLLTAVRNS